MIKIIVAVGLLFSILEISFSDEIKKGFATFDAYSVILFHPQMKDFDFIKMSFKRLPPLEKSVKQWNKEKNAVMDSIETLNYELKDLKESNRLIVHQRMLDLRKMYSDYDAYLIHWNRYLASINNDYKKIESKIRKKLHLFYFSKEETEKKLLLVWKSVLSGLRIVSKEKNIKAFIPYHSNHLNKGFKTLEQKLDYLSFDKYLSSFYQFMNLKEEKSGFFDYVLLKDHFKYYRNANKLVKFAFKQEKVLGVEDLTLDVILVILKKEGFGEDALGRTKRVYLEWLKQRNL